MNGFEAVEAIREFNQALPIIAISASAFETEQQRSLDAGCNAFLAKPVNEQSLLTLLEKPLKLEWIYEEERETEERSEAEEIPPPQAELEKLYEAAMLGMMSQIRKQMDKLEQLDSQYAPFADKVRKFARVFEEEKIVALVEGYLESTDLL